MIIYKKANFKESFEKFNKKLPEFLEVQKLNHCDPMPKHSV